MAFTKKDAHMELSIIVGAEESESAIVDRFLEFLLDDGVARPSGPFAVFREILRQARRLAADGSGPEAMTLKVQALGKRRFRIGLRGRADVTEKLYQVWMGLSKEPHQALRGVALIQGLSDHIDLDKEEHTVWTSVSEK